MVTDQIIITKILLADQCITAGIYIVTEMFNDSFSLTDQ
jgi:hypothetical protein